LGMCVLMCSLELSCHSGPPGCEGIRLKGHSLSSSANGGLPALHVLPVPHVPDGRTIRQSTKISRTCEAPAPYIPDNGLVERLMGSALHERTDHVIVFNEDHLRRILSEYASYYNEVRTHLSLGKDAPCTRPIERFGHIIAQPMLGGLHHRYARI
jgi:hypothetical protein